MRTRMRRARRLGRLVAAVLAVGPAPEIATPSLWASTACSVDASLVPSIGIVGRRIAWHDLSPAVVSLATGAYHASTAGARCWRTIPVAEPGDVAVVGTTIFRALVPIVREQGRVTLVHRQLTAKPTGRIVIASFGIFHTSIHGRLGRDMLRSATTTQEKQCWDDE